MEGKNLNYDPNSILEITESSFRKIQGHYSGFLKRLYYRNKIEKDRKTLVDLIKDLEPLISDESIEKEWKHEPNIDKRISTIFAQAKSLKSRIQVYLENPDNFSLEGYFNDLYKEMKSIKRMLFSNKYHQI